MKKVKLKMPISSVDAFALFLMENEINVVLSWSISDYFDTSFYCIAGVTEEQGVKLLASSFKKFIIQ